MSWRLHPGRSYADLVTDILLLMRRSLDSKLTSSRMLLSVLIVVRRDGVRLSRILKEKVSRLYDQMARKLREYVI